MMAFPENVGYPISDGPSAGIQQYYLLEIHFDNPKMEQGVHVKFGTRLHYTNKLRLYNLTFFKFHKVILQILKFYFC